MKIMRSLVVLGGVSAVVVCNAQALDWKQSVLSERSGGAAAYDAGHGNVVLFGGSSFVSTLSFGDTWIWDGSKWERRSPQASPAASGLAPAFGEYAMAYDAARQEVVLFGGSQQTWVWNGAAWIQKSPQTSPPSRFGHAMTFDASHDQIVLFGGVGNTGVLADTWVWNGANWAQKSPQTSPPARQGHVMSYDAVHRQVVLFGGASPNGYLPNIYLNDTWIWDGTNWTSRAPVHAPSSRYASGLADDPFSGQLLLFGGQNYPNSSGNATWFSDTWSWNGTDWTQLSPQTSPPVRGGHVMVYDSDQRRVVLFGGQNSGGCLSDTWQWNGFDWISDNPAPLPRGRTNHAMATDYARGQAVLFGGKASNPLTPQNVSPVLNDTWLWDGRKWTESVPKVSPSARMYHAMTYDATHGQVVLFGGTASTQSVPGLSDTWVWDGRNWSEKVPTNSPGPRAAHAMAYDAAHNRVVLFGGETLAPLGPPFIGPLYDTWLWDGQNWAQSSPHNIPNVTAPLMTYDVLHRQVVLFGIAIGATGQQTWVWDGSNWTQKLPAASPPYCCSGPSVDFGPKSGTLAYDFARQRVVFVTGSETWEWDGANWSQAFPAHEPLDTGCGGLLACSDFVMTNDATNGKLVLLGPLSDLWRLH